MPPNFGEIVYGATAWSFKHPIIERGIGHTFRQARKIFDEAGFSEKRCAIEVFAVYEPTTDLEYAHKVEEAARKNNLIPVTTIFRPAPNPSMVAASTRERKQAVNQCKKGIEFAVTATPEGLPVVVNGPFQLVHGLGKEEALDKNKRGYLLGCLEQIGDFLEKQDRESYAALEILRPSETKMTPKIDYWMTLLAEVGSRNIGLLVDTVHFYEGNGRNTHSMLESIDRVCEAGRCYSVHLSNSPRTEWEEKGEIAKHTGAILRILQRHNCNVTVDYEGFDHSLDEAIGIERRPDQADQIEVARRSMAYLSEHVQSI